MRDLHQLNQQLLSQQHQLLRQQQQLQQQQQQQQPQQSLPIAVPPQLPNPHSLMSPPSKLDSIPHFSSNVAPQHLMMQSPPLIHHHQHQSANQSISHHDLNPNPLGFSPKYEHHAPVPPVQPRPNGNGFRSTSNPFDDHRLEEALQHQHERQQQQQQVEKPKQQPKSQQQQDQQGYSAYSTEKSFICEICGKAFRFRSNLAEHRSVHTALKPYVCKYCGKSSRLKGNLTKHILKHHKQETNAVVGREDIIIKKGKKSVKDPKCIDFLEKSMIVLTGGQSGGDDDDSDANGIHGRNQSLDNGYQMGDEASGETSFGTADSFSRFRSNGTVPEHSSPFQRAVSASQHGRELISPVSSERAAASSVLAALAATALNRQRQKRTGSEHLQLPLASSLSGPTSPVPSSADRYGNHQPEGNGGMFGDDRIHTQQGGDRIPQLGANGSNPLQSPTTTAQSEQLAAALRYYHQQRQQQESQKQQEQQQQQQLQQQHQSFQLQSPPQHYQPNRPQPNYISILASPPLASSQGSHLNGTANGYQSSSADTTPLKASMSLKTNINLDKSSLPHGGPFVGDTINNSAFNNHYQYPHINRLNSGPLVNGSQLHHQLHQDQTAGVSQSHVIPSNATGDAQAQPSTLDDSLNPCHEALKTLCNNILQAAQQSGSPVQAGSQAETADNPGAPEKGAAFPSANNISSTSNHDLINGATSHHNEIARNVQSHDSKNSPNVTAAFLKHYNTIKSRILMEQQKQHVQAGDSNQAMFRDADNHHSNDRNIPPRIDLHSQQLQLHHQHLQDLRGVPASPHRQVDSHPMSSSSGETESPVQGHPQMFIPINDKSSIGVGNGGGRVQKRTRRLKRAKSADRAGGRGPRLLQEGLVPPDSQRGSGDGDDLRPDYCDSSYDDEEEDEDDGSSGRGSFIHANGQGIVPLNHPNDNYTASDLAVDRLLSKLSPIANWETAANARPNSSGAVPGTQCSFCGKHFRKHSQLESHLKLKHGQEIQSHQPSAPRISASSVSPPLLEIKDVLRSSSTTGIPPNKQLRKQRPTQPLRNGHHSELAGANCELSKILEQSVGKRRRESGGMSASGFKRSKFNDDGRSGCRDPQKGIYGFGVPNSECLDKQPVDYSVDAGHLPQLASALISPLRTRNGNSFQVPRSRQLDNPKSFADVTEPRLDDSLNQKFNILSGCQDSILEIRQQMNEVKDITGLAPLKTLLNKSLPNEHGTGLLVEHHAIEAVLGSLDTRVSRVERQMEASLSTLGTLIQVQTSMNASLKTFRTQILEQVNTIAHQLAPVQVPVSEHVPNGAIVPEIKDVLADSNSMLGSNTMLDTGDSKDETLGLNEAVNGTVASDAAELETCKENIDFVAQDMKLPDPTHQADECVMNGDDRSSMLSNSTTVNGGLVHSDTDAQPADGGSFGLPNSVNITTGDVTST